MKQEIISIETAKKLADAEKNEKIIKEALEYIEKKFEFVDLFTLNKPNNKPYYVEILKVQELLNILRGKNEK